MDFIVEIGEVLIIRQLRIFIKKKNHFFYKKICAYKKKVVLLQHNWSREQRTKNKDLLALSSTTRP